MHISSIVWIWGWILTLMDFMSKGLRFPHWRQLVWNGSFPLSGCFVSPECSKQDTQWHLSVCHSRSEAPSDPGCSCWAQHGELLWGIDLSPGTQVCRRSPKWEHPITVKAWAPSSSPLFSLPFTSCFIYLPLLHFCPLATINQRSVTDTGNGVGAVDSNDTTLHTLYFLPAVTLQQLSQQSPAAGYCAPDTSLINTEWEVVCLTPHKIQLLCI